MNYSEAYQRLIVSQEFEEWKEEYPEYYLTHFYHLLDCQFDLVGDWEIGFYNKETDKIMVFSIGEEISLKAEAEVFKEGGIVPELELKKVKVKLEGVFESFKKIKKEEYSKEILLNGFLILQNFQDKLMWNLSFATRSLNILNLKVDATNKKVISHQLVNFVESKAS